MTPCSPVPLPLIANGSGGWSIPASFTDVGGNPIDLTQPGLTVHADFYQGNLNRTTSCAVSLTDGVNGAAAALVPAPIVASTLAPFPNTRFISSVQPGVAPPFPFRIHFYIVDSLGARSGEQAFAIQPLDVRTADFSTLPQPQPFNVVVGPAGPKGDTGAPGAKGDPGGLTPYTGKAATTISDGEVLILTTAGLLLASSDQASQAGSVVGIAVGGSTAGQQQAYLDTGPYTNAGWTWTAGLPIFVGLNGQPTQEAPTAGFRQQIATALGTTSLKIALAPARVFA